MYSSNYENFTKYHKFIEELASSHNISLDYVNIKHKFEENENGFSNFLNIINITSTHIKVFESFNNELYKLDKSLFIDYSIKKAIYQIFVKKYKISSEYGYIKNKIIENGIKLFKTGLSEYSIKETLINYCFVSEINAQIVIDMLKSNNRLVKNNNQICLNVNISNLSPLQDREEYFNCLNKEICEVKEIIKENSLIIKSIQFNIDKLNCEDIELYENLFSNTMFSCNEKILKTKDVKNLNEKFIQLLKNYKFNVIKLDALSLNDKSLKCIKVNYTLNDILRVYKAIISSQIKLDLILLKGIPKETFAQFCETVSVISDLYLTNVTIKNYIGADYDLNIEQKKGELFNQKIKEKFHKVLYVNDFKAYCIFAKNKEEYIKYCSDHNEITYDMDKLNNTCSIISCGVGVESKYIDFVKNSTKLLKNPIDIDDYVKNINEIIKNKTNLID